MTSYKTLGPAERRHDRRLERPLKGVINGDEVTIADFSLGGLRIADFQAVRDGRIGPGAELAVQLPAITKTRGDRPLTPEEEKPIKVVAVLVRYDKASKEVGLQFKDLSNEAFDRLEMLTMRPWAGEKASGAPDGD